MQRILRILIAAGIICLGHEARAETRVALVIGNAAYADVKPLATPRKDAEAIAKLFQDSGFDQVDLQLDAGNAAFGAAVRKFAETAAKADIAVIFFAGHGLEVRGVNYLVPVDARLASEGDAPEQAVSLERLVSAAEGAKKLRLVILDACRDNAFARNMQRASPGNVGPEFPGFGRVEPVKSNTLIAYAARAGSTSVEGEDDHSPYTAALLESIALPGLDVRLALGRVRNAVMKATANRQEPFVYGSMDGSVQPLVPVRDQPLSDDSEQAKSDFDLVKKVGSKAAWEVFLKTYSTGIYADMARAELKKFDKPAGDMTKPNWGDDIYIKRLQQPK
jgi:uncharacterized caspase-like protein